MKKKILASLLALCMIVAILPISAFAADSKFNDKQPSWGEAAINRWADAGIIKGYPDGSFKPNKNITRGEFAIIVSRLMGYKNPTTTNPFVDLNPDSQNGKALLKLYEAGVTNGAGRNSEGKRIAAPNSSITRQEAATMLGRALKIKPEGTSTFKDAGKIASWAKGYVAVLQAHKWVQGVGGGNFAPTSYITRAQAAKMLGNIVTVYVTKDETITDTKGGIVVVAGGTAVGFAAKTTVPVIVAPKSTGTTVTFAADSEASNVVVMGTGTTITGAGDVDKVEVTKEASGALTVSTDDTDVVNNSSVAVDTPAGDIAANGGVGNTTPEIEVTIAGLNPVDRSETDPIGDMPTVTATLNNRTITLSTDGPVPVHKNENNADGCWVGVAFKAPDNATGFKYAFTAEGNLTVSNSLEEIGENISLATGVTTFDEGATFWFDAASEGPTAYIQLQWTGNDLTEAEKTVQKYTIDMTGVQLPTTEYTLSIKTLVAEKDKASVSDITSIQINDETAVDVPSNYDNMTATAAAGETVTIKVTCTRCIATCLMGVNEADVNKTDLLTISEVTPFATTSERTATYTIEVKMPTGGATLGIGVLEACSSSTAYVSGLSACEANNTTIAGMFEGDKADWDTFVPDELGPSD